MPIANARPKLAGRVAVAVVMIVVVVVMMLGHARV